MTVSETTPTAKTGLITFSISLSSYQSGEAVVLYSDIQYNADCCNALLNAAGYGSADFSNISNANVSLLADFSYSIVLEDQ